MESTKRKSSERRTSSRRKNSGKTHVFWVDSYFKKTNPEKRLHKNEDRFGVKIKIMEHIELKDKY